MSDVGLSIISTECASACAGEPDLEQRIAKAMKPVANSHWMFPGDDDLRFRGAIGGVLLSPDTTENDKARIMASLSQLRSMSALMAGVPVDIEAMSKELEDGPKPLPLIKMWHEAKKSE